MPADPAPDRHRAAFGDRPVSSGTLEVGSALPAADSTAPEPAHTRLLPALVSGAATAIFGAMGTAVGVTAMFHHFAAVRIGWLLPLAGVQLAIDPLGGLFLAITGAVAVAVGIYAVGYARRQRLPGFTLVVLPLFVVALLLVPAAGSVTTFLFGWELMATTSALLVLTEHHRAAVRSAAVFYAVLTQLGFGALLLGLLVLSASGQADSFVSTRGPDRPRSPYHPRPRVRSDLDRVRIEGRPIAAACLAATHAPRGTEPGLGVDERRDGEPGYLRHCPIRPPTARPRTALVGAGPIDRGWAVGGVRGAARLDRHRPEAAAGLFDNREHGLDRPGPRRRDPALRGRRNGGRGDRADRRVTAPDCARRVQDAGLPGRRGGAGRDGAAGFGPFGRAGPADAGDHRAVRAGRTRAPADCRWGLGSSASGCCWSR